VTVPGTTADRNLGTPCSGSRSPPWGRDLVALSFRKPENPHDDARPGAPLRHRQLLVASLFRAVVTAS
jgi:hypothetical protein